GERRFSWSHARGGFGAVSATESPASRAADYSGTITSHERCFSDVKFVGSHRCEAVGWSSAGTIGVGWTASCCLRRAACARISLSGLRKIVSAFANACRLTLAAQSRTLLSIL